MSDLTSETVTIDAVRPHPKNVRQGDIGAISESLTAHGQYRAIVAQRSTGHIIAGNHTWKAAKALGWKQITVHWLDIDDERALRILLADNRANDLATYDDAALAEVLRHLSETSEGLAGTLFDGDAIDTLLTDIGHEWEDRTPLAEQYGAPPFSVLDTRQGYWQQRRRRWLALGIESEIGRPEQLARDNSNWIERGIVASDSRLANGTSVFDPVLTEIMVRRYSNAGDAVLDPFAGGSVRGIVTTMLGRTYTGIDLRAEQIAANRQQAQTILGTEHPHPVWYAGDSRDIDSMIGDQPADLILTCPPYGDLERYSDDPADLSAMTDHDFITAYRHIITRTMSHLRDDRFAVIVVGDYRDTHGNYQNFVSSTIDAVRSTGAHLYNEAVLINAVGTGAMVAGTYMRASRKIVKLHQNVLVFLKGNAKRATQHCGDLGSDQLWQQHLPAAQP